MEPWIVNVSKPLKRTREVAELIRFRQWVQFRFLDVKDKTSKCKNEQIWWKPCNSFQIATNNLKNILAQIWTILASNYTVFIKAHAILPKRRRILIHNQLNKLLENCLKTLLVGFWWADVLRFSLITRKRNAVSCFWFDCWGPISTGLAVVYRR